MVIERFFQFSSEGIDQRMMSCERGTPSLEHLRLICIVADLLWLCFGQNGNEVAGRRAKCIIRHDHWVGKDFYRLGRDPADIAFGCMPTVDHPEQFPHDVQRVHRAHAKCIQRRLMHEVKPAFAEEMLTCRQAMLLHDPLINSHRLVARKQRRYSSDSVG
jgi:hypothetical protein